MALNNDRKRVPGELNCIPHKKKICRPDGTYAENSIEQAGKGDELCVAVGNEEVEKVDCILKNYNKEINSKSFYDAIVMAQGLNNIPLLELLKQNQGDHLPAIKELQDKAHNDAFIRAVEEEDIKEVKKILGSLEDLDPIKVNEAYEIVKNKGNHALSQSIRKALKKLENEQEAELDPRNETDNVQVERKEEQRDLTNNNKEYKEHLRKNNEETTKVNKEVGDPVNTTSEQSRNPGCFQTKEGKPDLANEPDILQAQIENQQRECKNDITGSKEHLQIDNEETTTVNKEIGDKVNATNEQSRKLDIIQGKVDSVLSLVKDAVNEFRKDRELMLEMFRNLQGESNKNKHSKKQITVLNYIEPMYGETGGQVKFKVREGAKADSRNLEMTFERLGYVVKIHENLTKDQTDSVLDNLQQDTNLNFLLLVVLSHGLNEDIFITSDGHEYRLKSIQYRFTDKKCPHLMGKDKVVISNFCRGNKREEFARDAAIPDPDHGVPHHMITIHASHDGFAALRHPTKGTLFIQHLCEVLKEQENKQIQKVFNCIYEKMRLVEGTTPEMKISAPFAEFSF